MIQFQRFFLFLFATILTWNTSSLAANTEYLIVAKDKEVKQALHKKISKISHELKYHQGFVAELDDNTAATLISEFAGRAQIEPNITFYISTTGTSSAKGQGGNSTTPVQPTPQEIPWGINSVNAPLAHAITKGAGVNVCVVDTGIQRNHPDLSNSIIGENFVVSRNKVDPNKWDDDNGHGTHVAGTIAALDNAYGVVGVAPEAQLLAAKVLDRRGSGSLSSVAEGIRFCISHNADVINMSLGSSADSTTLHDALIDAYNAGIKIVAAAGNESTSVSYPAKYNEVFAITAIDQNLNLAYFSNFGPEVDYTAPGVNVKSTTIGSTYKTLSGTSMASPHAAGVFALAIASGRTQIASSLLPLLTSVQQGSGLVDAQLSVESN